MSCPSCRFTLPGGFCDACNTPHSPAPVCTDGSLCGFGNQHIFCGAASPNSWVICTRPSNHDGPHVACDLHFFHPNRRRLDTHNQEVWPL